MKKAGLIFGLLVALLLGANFIRKQDFSTGNWNGRSLTELIAERGKPDFLATGLDIKERRVKALRLAVPLLDPAAVTNWNTMTNVILVWAESPYCRRDARFFYDEMKSDTNFDGGGWYSSRSLFGERALAVWIGKEGKAVHGQRIFYEAVALHAPDLVRWTNRMTQTPREQ